jgi:hypothetical protein
LIKATGLAEILPEHSSSLVATYKRKTKMSNFERTANWLKACGKDQSESNLSLQIGCDIEEGVEFLACIVADTNAAQFLLNKIVYDLQALGMMFKRGEAKASIPVELRTHALDALCDREVTGNGVAYFASFDKPSADKAVLAANDAKLVDGKPVILPGGKIGKPAGWTAPDLKGFV